MDSILKFLEMLEAERGCRVSTRNVRLTAIRMFFRYASGLEPACMDACKRIADIPSKRDDVRDPSYLLPEQLTELLTCIDQSTDLGRRDHLLMLFLYDTGARVQEVVDLRLRDLRLVSPEQVVLTGKGRKQRVVPLSSTSAKLLQEHSVHYRRRTEDAVFVSRRGQPLTRSGIAQIVARHAAVAASRSAHAFPSHVSPHTLRHTTAVHMLEAGVELNVIRAILGHASLATTHHYARLTVRGKRAALVDLWQPAGQTQRGAPARWKTDADVIAFLRSL